MFRNVSLVILAFTVLGTAPLDAQLFRRLRSAAQQNRRADAGADRQDQASQKQSQKPELAQPPKGTQPPAQKGSAPGQNGATQSLQARSPQRFSIFIDRNTGRPIWRPVGPSSNQTPASRQRGKETNAPDPVMPPTRVAGGQTDIARQAVQRQRVPELTGPESNPRIQKDPNVVRATNTELAPSLPPDPVKDKKSISILESYDSGAAEPEKPKPTVSVLELTGPDKGK